MKGFLAGIMISLGAYVYLNIGGVAGAILFAFGIISIVKLGIPLYTGVAGTDIKFTDKINVLGQNIAGATVCAILFALCNSQKPIDVACGIVAAKYAAPWFITFIKAILCGLIVDVSVYLSKQDGSMIPLIFGIPVFILCGFNHSIADVTYVILGANGNMANPWSLPLYYGICVVGNYVGCNVRRLCLSRS